MEKGSTTTVGVDDSADGARVAGILEAIVELQLIEMCSQSCTRPPGYRQHYDRRFTAHAQLHSRSAHVSLLAATTAYY